MIRKFIVKYVGGYYDESNSVEVEIGDNESTICGYVSWLLLHHRANSILLYRVDKDDLHLVAVAEKKVLVTLMQKGAADITKLI